MGGVVTSGVYIFYIPYLLICTIFPRILSCHVILVRLSLAAINRLFAVCFLLTYAGELDRRKKERNDAYVRKCYC